MNFKYLTGLGILLPFTYLIDNFGENQTVIFIFGMASLIVMILPAIIHIVYSYKKFEIKGTSKKIEIYMLMVFYLVSYLLLYVSIFVAYPFDIISSVSSVVIFVGVINVLTLVSGLLFVVKSKVITDDTMNNLSFKRAFTPLFLGYYPILFANLYVLYKLVEATL